MRAEHDVVVVGAGPAGLLVAVRLAASGRRVVVVEREDRPRDGVLILPPAAAELLEGAGLGAAVRTVAGGAVADRLELASERERVVLPLTAPVRAVPRRPVLAAMAARAGALGVELRWGLRAEVPLWGGRRVIGVRCLRGDGGAEEVRARAVVDASGPATFLAGAVGQLQPRRGRPRRSVTVALPGGADPQACVLHLVRRAWTVVTGCRGGTAAAVIPVGGVGPEREGLPLATGEVPWDRLELVDARRTVGVLTRAQAGEGWVAVGSAAGRAAPGAPGATAMGLEVAAAVSVELEMALARGRGVGTGALGATVALARQEVHLESALVRVLHAAAGSGTLGWVGAHPSRAALAAGMLLGEWAERGGRLRRYLLLWRLGRLARRIQ